MNRPHAKQLRRTTIQAAAIAVIEAGIDQLETVATNAGLHPSLSHSTSPPQPSPPPSLPPLTATPPDPMATAQITATVSLSGPTTTIPAPDTRTGRKSAQSHAWPPDIDLGAKSRYGWGSAT